MSSDRVVDVVTRVPARRFRRHRAWLAVSACLVGTVAWAALIPSATYTVEVGPVSLPAGGGHGSMAHPAPLKLRLPLDGWLRGMSFEVVDARGRRLPDSLLHHLNLIVPDRRELFSPIRLRIGGAGPETKPVSLPAVVGVRLRPGDSLIVKAMLHNPTSTAYDGVRLRVRLLYTPAKRGARPLSIQPLYLDVMPPAGLHSFDLPPGRSSMSWEGRPAIPVRLLAAGGHLHRYGTALRLEDVTAGRLIWEAHPLLSPDGAVAGMPTKYFLPFGAKLVPDHIYRLTAMYDNPTGKVIPDGGMGTLGGVVLPSGESVWPAVARNDSAYQLDVRVIDDKWMDPAMHHHP